MSALPPKADIGIQPRNVRFVPKADIALGPGPTPQFAPQRHRGGSPLSQHTPMSATDRTAT
jgi:hypothetical protein